MIWWLARYIDVEKDEKLIANSSKARMSALSLFVSIVMCCEILLEGFLGQWFSVKTKYDIIVGVINITFSLSFIVYGYLLDKYEKLSR